MLDSSNHNDLKIIPSLVRYFLPGGGLKTFILEFVDFPNKTIYPTKVLLNVLSIWSMKHIR